MFEATNATGAQKQAYYYSVRFGCAFLRVLRGRACQVKRLQLLELRDQPYQGPWETAKGYDWDGTVLPRRYSCVDLDATVMLSQLGERDVDPSSGQHVSRDT